MNCLLVSSSWVVAIAMMNIIDVLQWKWWCNCCSVFSCDVYFANAILNVNCYDSAVVLDCYCCIIFWASGNRFWENTSPRDLIGEKRVSFRPSFWSNKTHQSTPKNSRNGTPNTILRVSLPPNSRFPKVFPTSQPSQQLFKRDQLEHLRLHRHLEAQHRTTLMGDANFKTSPSSFFLEIKNLGFWIFGPSAGQLQDLHRTQFQPSACALDKVDAHLWNHLRGWTMQIGWSTCEKLVNHYGKINKKKVQ